MCALCAAVRLGDVSILSARLESSVPENDSSEYILAYSTLSNTRDASKISSSLVSERLAACVSTVPGIQSTYQWKGEIVTDSEVLLLIKTRKSLLPKLQEKIQEIHPYETPELIAVPLVGGLPAYLQWINDSTRPASP